jgi:hypothetical protein
MPFIHSHEISNKIHTFYDETFSSDSSNIFTILVGKNGSGKSRLLNSLIMKGLSQNKYVLAISNSMYHKFPPSRKDHNGYFCFSNNRNIIKNYNYSLALNSLIDNELIEIIHEQNLLDIYPLDQFKDWNIQSLLPLLILKIQKDTSRSHQLKQILNFLGFNDDIHITITNNKKNCERFISQFDNSSNYYHHKSINYETILNLAINIKKNKTTEYFFPLIHNNKSFSIIGHGLALGLFSIKK